MELSVREEAGRRAVLSLRTGLGGGFYWEVQVRDARQQAGEQCTTAPYKFASPAQAASDGFRFFNSLSQPVSDRAANTFVANAA